MCKSGKCRLYQGQCYPVPSYNNSAADDFGNIYRTIWNFLVINVALFNGDYSIVLKGENSHYENSFFLLRCFYKLCAAKALNVGFIREKLLRGIVPFSYLGYTLVEKKPILNWHIYIYEHCNLA